MLGPMHVPVMVPGVLGPQCTRRARWPGRLGLMRAPGSVAQPERSRRASATARGAGVRPGSAVARTRGSRRSCCRSGGGAGSSMRWGGGELAVGVSAQPPAALMDRPMMGPAQQDQVGQIRRAAMQPVAHMMGFAPGWRPPTAREPTAAVPHGQGAALGGGHDPAGPPDLKWLGGGTTQGRGQGGRRGPQPPLQVGLPVVVVGRDGLLVAGAVGRRRHRRQGGAGG